MEKLINTITSPIYTYDPQEFMPIWEEGHLANKGAFIAYKIKRAGQRIVNLAN